MVMPGDVTDPDLAEKLCGRIFSCPIGESWSPILVVRKPDPPVLVVRKPDPPVLVVRQPDPPVLVVRKPDPPILDTRKPDPPVLDARQRCNSDCAVLR